MISSQACRIGLDPNFDVSSNIKSGVVKGSASEPQACLRGRHADPEK